MAASSDSDGWNGEAVQRLRRAEAEYLLANRDAKLAIPHREVVDAQETRRVCLQAAVMSRPRPTCVGPVSHGLPGHWGRHMHGGNFAVHTSWHPERNAEKSKLPFKAVSFATLYTAVEPGKAVHALGVQLYSDTGACLVEYQASDVCAWDASIKRPAGLENVVMGAMPPPETAQTLKRQCQAAARQGARKRHSIPLPAPNTKAEGKRRAA